MLRRYKCRLCGTEFKTDALGAKTCPNCHRINVVELGSDVPKKKIVRIALLFVVVATIVTLTVLLVREKIQHSYDNEEYRRQIAQLRERLGETDLVEPVVTEIDTLTQAEKDSLNHARQNAEAQATDVPAAANPAQASASSSCPKAEGTVSTQTQRSKTEIQSQCEVLRHDIDALQYLLNKVEELKNTTYAFDTPKAKEDGRAKKTAMRDEILASWPSLASLTKEQSNEISSAKTALSAAMSCRSSDAERPDKSHIYSGHFISIIGIIKHVIRQLQSELAELEVQLEEDHSTRK